MTEELAQIYRKTYLKKILNIQAWKRLLTCKTDFRLFFKVFRFKRDSTKKMESIDIFTEKVPAFNHILFESFCELVDNKIPMLCVYGSHDKARIFFEEFYLKRFLNKFI